MTRPEDPAGSPRVLMLRLLSGPLRGSQAILFGAAPLSVGSGEGADLRLPDPGIAPKHLLLQIAGDGVEVWDLTSEGGTPRRLPPGSVLRVGDTEIEIANPAGAPEPQAHRPPEISRLGAILGKSGRMKTAFDAITCAAKTTAAVLIEGPPGTGKSLAAREIHRLSKRSKGPFVVVDLADVPAERLGDRLFGAEGAFRAAEGGTLFLRRLSEPVPEEVQARLLKVVEARAIDGHRVDFRLITSAQRPLTGPLAARLGAIRLELPPLRERPEDLALLAQHFLARARSSAALDDHGVEILSRHPWPRNVRELEDVIDAAARSNETLADALIEALVHSM